MKRIEVERYFDAINGAAIRLPGRRFPGVLFQGDPLYILYSSAKELYQGIKDSTDQDTVDGAAELVNNLATRLLIYVDALGAHEMDLPFFGSITTVEYSADC